MYDLIIQLNAQLKYFKNFLQKKKAKIWFTLEHIVKQTKLLKKIKIFMHVLLNNKHICNTNKKLKQLPSKYRKIFLYLLSSKNKNKKI